MDDAIQTSESEVSPNQPIPKLMRTGTKSNIIQRANIIDPRFNY